MADIPFLTDGSAETQADLNSNANADYDASNGHLWALVNTALAGSGTATARLHGTAYVWEDKTFDIAFEYFRDCDIVGGGTATVSVYTINDNGVVNKYPLEEITSTVSGTVTYDVDVPMEGGNSYELGLELRARGSSFFNAQIADLWNSKGFPPGMGPRHRLVVKDAWGEIA